MSELPTAPSAVAASDVGKEEMAMRAGISASSVYDFVREWRSANPDDNDWRVRDAARGLRDASCKLAMVVEGSQAGRRVADESSAQPARAQEEEHREKGKTVMGGNRHDGENDSETDHLGQSSGGSTTADGDGGSPAGDDK